MPYTRGASTVRPFAASEDQLITDWRIQGHGTTAIARRLSEETGYLRSPATINMRLKTLARIEEQDAP